MIRYIELPQQGRTLVVQEGATVLEAALAAGIAYPHGCRAGRCGSCLSRLISGTVQHRPHSRFALTDVQKAQGWFLACSALPQTDLVAAWAADLDAGPSHAVQRLDCHVQEIETLTHDIKRIRLAVGDAQAMAFRAGQYVRLTFPGAPPRDYSMAGQTGAGELDFHIRRVPGGLASERVHARLRIGDPVLMEGPLGASHYRRQHAGPILCIAGGSGLAPILAIVEAALADGTRQPIHVYVGARTARDLYLVAHFKQLARAHAHLTFTPVLSQDADQARWRTGWVTDAVAEDHPRMEGWKAYVAGPPPMVEAAMRICRAARLGPDDLHADVFFTPDAAPVGA